MRLIIDGTEYDGSRQPFLGDLKLLKPAFGFGYGTVMQRLQSLDESSDMATLLDDVDFVEALLAWMYLARLRAGDRSVSVQDVRRTPLDGFQILPDDDPDDADTAAEPDTASNTTQEA